MSPAVYYMCLIIFNNRQVFAPSEAEGQYSFRNLGMEVTKYIGWDYWIDVLVLWIITRTQSWKLEDYCNRKRYIWICRVWSKTIRVAKIQIECSCQPKLCYHIIEWPCFGYWFEIYLRQASPRNMHDSSSGTYITNAAIWKHLNGISQTKQIKILLLLYLLWLGQPEVSR